MLILRPAGSEAEALLLASAPSQLECLTVGAGTHLPLLPCLGAVISNRGADGAAGGSVLKSP